MKLRKLGFWPVVALITGLVCLFLACQRLEAAVMLIAQPESRVAAPGSKVEFSIVATSNRALRYYWYKNGVMLSAKDAKLVIASVNASHAGTYSCLVSDGTDIKGRCAEFTLTVQDIAPPVPPGPTATCKCECPLPTARNATLSWNHPGYRADGSVLPSNQISGYQIYAMGGPEASAASTKLDDLQLVTSYISGNLQPGTHYFRVKTVDSKGLLSAFSDLVTVTIQ